MTPADDQLDDAMAERLFAGRADSPELEPLATAVRALREVSAQPVQPSAALRQQMAAGVFTGGPVYAYRPATHGPVRRVAAATVAKLGRLRLATKRRRFRSTSVAKLAAAGFAAVVLGTATAGFAGSLPEPVQHRFETVVESVTPYQFPEKTGERPGNPATDPDTTEPGTTEPREGGGGVGEGANDGGVEPPQVSEEPGERGHGRPTDLPPPAQEAPGQQRRPTAPPGQRD